MTMKDFIRQNRAELTEAIGSALGSVPREASCYCPMSGTNHKHPAKKLCDADIREWIANDEGLYSWARSKGVRI